MQQEVIQGQSSILYREINPGTGHPSFQQGHHIIYLMACRAQSDNHCSRQDVSCIGAASASGEAIRLGKPSCRRLQDLLCSHMTHHYKSARTGEAHLSFQQCGLQALLAPKCSANRREEPSESLPSPHWPSMPA